ncbi:hypothetical protein BCON_0344g00080 [Botryotinia convoluta]|uniref:Uncharacterized protein n=1 Tax=Botryotinia convoluta TaxID=54673 RepID=A0A4Z1HAM4_9HELO|nr:hypothetical protein BCON_0344g00080 [Botryotinia convoluta]
MPGNKTSSTRSTHKEKIPKVNVTDYSRKDEKDRKQKTPEPDNKFLTVKRDTSSTSVKKSGAKQSAPANIPKIQVPRRSVPAGNESRIKFTKLAYHPGGDLIRSSKSQDPDLCSEFCL